MNINFGNLWTNYTQNWELRVSNFLSSFCFEILKRDNDQWICCFEDIAGQMWTSISKRLKNEKEIWEESIHQSSVMSFFGDGHIGYLRKTSNNEIKRKVQTLSSRNSCEPTNVVFYEDNSKYLCTNERRTNNFLCFEFKTDRVTNWCHVHSAKEMFGW